MPFHVALICGRGHLLSAAIDRRPSERANYCPQCGAPTLDACPSCSKPLRGAPAYPPRVRPGTIIRGMGPVPAFCLSCGKPFPWTEEIRRAVADLVEETNELSDEDRRTLSENVDDLISDSAKTPVAASRWKRVLGKLSPGAAEAFQKILAAVIVEAAKTILFPHR